MTCTPPAHQGWSLTLAAVLPLVASRTLLPTLAADGVTGHARGAGARLPAAWPKEARLALCRGRGERGLQGSAGPEALPPQLCTHRPGTARPRSPPCRHSCRPSCHTRACSAAHTGTPPSSPARRPTVGRLHPRTNREGACPLRAPTLPSPGSPGPHAEPLVCAHSTDEKQGLREALPSQETLRSSLPPSIQSFYKELLG